jgi:hypothetical protein
MAKADGKLNKNALAGKRGASTTLTPHVCPSCSERIAENQLLVVMQFNGDTRRRTQGYHRGCYRLQG